MTVSQQMAVKYLKKGASFSSSPQIMHELPVGLHFLCIAQCSAGKQQDTRSRTGPHRTRKSTPVSLSLCVSLGFFPFLCSFFPLTFHPHSLLTCLQVHYTGCSNWSLQPFLPPSVIPRATSMGVCTSYAQDSVLRTWFNAGLLPALNFYLFIYLVFPRSLLDLFFFILLFNFTILYWFCHTSTWIHHRYTRVPHPEPSSLPIPSLWVVPVHQPHASSIVHQTRTGDLFHI